MMNTSTMNTSSTETGVDRWDVFERSRRRLHGIAFRIVGSADDAEDVVQETSLRWLQADLATVRAPEGWLVAVTTRISIDRARRVATERQAYRRSWDLGLDRAAVSTATVVSTEVAAQVSNAFYVLRELLPIVERIAFVLREAFACEYDEIARVLEKSEVACRQIVHRARERVRRPRLRLRVHDAPDLAERFARAIAAGDRQEVLSVLNDEGTDGTRRGTRSAGALPGHVDRGGRQRRPMPDRGSWTSHAVMAQPAA
jgi:RNA polymerase sigma-70 factor (ECF subfamily)